MTRGYDNEAMRVEGRWPRRWRLMVLAFVIGFAAAIALGWVFG